MLWIADVRIQHHTLYMCVMCCLLQNLACKVEWLLGEKNLVDSELRDLLAQKEDLDVRLKDAENRMKELESRLQEEKFNKLYQLLGMLQLNLCSIHDVKVRSGLCCNRTLRRASHLFVTEPWVAVHIEVFIYMLGDKQLEKRFSTLPILKPVML